MRSTISKRKRNIKVEAASIEALHIKLRNIASIEKRHQALGNRFMIKIEIY